LLPQTSRGRSEPDVYASYVLLAACAGLLLWIVIAPETP
jgi:hypothetical protein